MNIEELKKLSKGDAIKKAAEYVGVSPSVIDGIWRTESNRGEKTLSPAGARGDFQIMPATQQLFEKKLGRKLNADDFYDSLAMAAEHLKDDLKREGNLPDALRAYNAGPNRKRWDNPETMAYAAKVLGNDGQPAAVPASAASAPTTGGSGPAMPKTAAAMATGAFLSSLTGAGNAEDTLGKAVSADVEQSRKTQAELDSTGLLDQARAAFMHQGVLPAVLNRLSRDTYEDTPGYVVPEDALVGLTFDAQERVRRAGSLAEQQRLRWEEDQYNEDMRVLSMHGPVQGFVAGMIAGLPEGMLTGMAATKALAVAGYGSQALARAGNLKGAVASNLAENVGANVLAAGVEDAITGRMSALDYGMAIGLGGVASGLSVPGSVRVAGQALAEKTALAAVARQVEVAQAAIDRLGPGASREQVLAEIARVEAGEVKANIDANTGSLPNSRRLVTSHPGDGADELFVPAQGDLNTSTTIGLTNPASTNAEFQGKPVLSANLLDVDNLVQPPTTRSTAVLEGRAFSEFMDKAVVTFEKAVGKESVRGYIARLGFDVDAVRAGAPRVWASKDMPQELVKAATWLQKTFMADAKVMLVNGGTSGAMRLTGNTKGQQRYFDEGVLAISINPSNKDAVRTLIHEIGHGVIFTQFDKLTAKHAEAFSTLHRAWIDAYTSTDARGAALMRGGVSARTTEQVEGYVNNPNKKFAASMFDIMATVVTEAGNLKPGSWKLNGEFARSYIPNSHEFGAEQFTRFIEAAVAKELSWKPTSMPMSIVKFFEDVWNKLADLFNFAKTNKLLAPDARMVDLFEYIRKKNKADSTIKERVAAGKDPYHDAATAVGATPDQFKKWFGKSVAKNADGSPKVYYHGSKASWDEYDMSLNGKMGGTKYALFVSPSKEYAGTYGNNNTLELYVRAENPFDFENPAHLAAYKAAGLDPYDDVKFGSWPVLEKPESTAWMKANGYDSFYTSEGGAKNLGLFDPNQIKSPRNQGTWSRSSNNIYAEAQADNSAVAIDPIAMKYGIDLMPEATALQRAEKRAMIELYTRADNPEAPWNKIDPKYLARMTDNSVVNIASTGLLLLKSQNPVARMVAHELLESTTGTGSRNTSAAIAKHLAERKFMGNVINEVQSTYAEWAKAKGYTMWQRYGQGEAWAEFNLNVAEHIEAVRMGRSGSDSPVIQQAAAHIEQAFERLRMGQVEGRTLGFGALPETSRGYMPHKMSPAKLRNITPQQTRAVWGALVDQFQSVEGWDATFSANLASKYIERIRLRADGGYDAPLGAHDASASDVVREALEAMNMSAEEIEANLKKFSRGGPSHTKKRLNLDLLTEYDNGDGTTFRLLDLYETDMLGLVRQQARRVSGEVALARYGIMGRPGLKVLRTSLGFGDAAGKIQQKELEAFDQVAAEFLGDPFGTHDSKWIDRALMFTSLSRLGGMGITQFGEYINFATTLGVSKAATAIADFPRLRKEVLALARGEVVENPIIGSIEQVGGGEFGTDAYKMVFPFDNPQMPYDVHGAQTLTLGDRLLRGGTHAQGKLSFWRAIHSVQQRGVAEQIVHKALRYVRTASEDGDKAMLDIGMTPQLVQRMRAQLDSAATWEGDRLSSFDVRKLDKDTADEFIQAVHRGSSQIIQGTYIGETGKWAHSGWTRLMSQFRTFSITAVEKQWGRNVSNHGMAHGLAILVGSMSMAAPLHMARVYAQSIGREDQEEYLKRRLTFEAVARATLNYVAMSGLAGDFMDAFSAVTGVGKPTGGRQGGGTEFVGTVVAPAAGVADDLWRAVQNTKDGTDVHGLIKNLPMANLPYLVPIINTLD